MCSVDYIYVKGSTYNFKFTSPTKESINIYNKKIKASTHLQQGKARKVQV